MTFYLDGYTEHDGSLLFWEETFLKHLIWYMKTKTFVIETLKKYKES